MRGTGDEPARQEPTRDGRYYVAGFVNVWLAWFVADACIGWLDEVGFVVFELRPLLLFRQLSALVLVPLSCVALGATAITPWAPARVVLPPLLFQLWALLGAMPLVLWTYLSGWFPLCFLVLQVVAGLVALAGARSLSGRWRLTSDAVSTRAVWSARRAVVVLVALPCVVVGSGGWLLWNLQYAVSYGSSGYMGVDLEGLHMTSRTLERDTSTVHLVGMIHLAEPGSYDALFASFGALGDAVVLEEGVTDRDGNLPASFGGYARVASRLGLEGQPRIPAVSGVVRRRADVDVSMFREDTLTLLDAVLGFYDAEDPLPALLTLQRVLQDLGGDERLLWLMLEDVVELRNVHLHGEILDAVTEHAHVVVPWGALHLPGVEEALLSDGFVVTGSSQRMVLRHKTWMAALGLPVGE